MPSAATRRARRLRRRATDAEGRLWYHVRARQVDGAKFRRQEPLGPYMVDFCCVESRLVVEVDGGQHFEQREYDEERSRFLELSGYRVLRFWNNEVMENIEGVLARIGEAVRGVAIVTRD
ncbi:endonuclease domain-containing protein [Candidatus Binatia bacterium]|nr:endonuclease domain-containing protein [Candidatus Binatia bacterium]